VVSIVELPEELRARGNILGKPGVFAAFAPRGIVVAVAQKSVMAAVARFDVDLADCRPRVLGRDDHAVWSPTRLVALSGGRVLLCTAPPLGSNLYVDAATADTVPAADLAGALPTGSANGEWLVRPIDAFMLGGQLIVGHAATVWSPEGYERLSNVPADGGEPRTWAELGKAVGAPDHGPALSGRWYACRSAVLDDRAVLMGEQRSKIGGRDRALVLLRPDGTVERTWKVKEALLKDRTAMLVADRGRLLTSAKGILHVRTDQLRIEIQAPSDHPFLTTHRLLAGDGQGRLLWLDARRHLLVLTGPDDLELGEGVDSTALGASLDKLVTATSAWARPATRRARPTGAVRAAARTAAKGTARRVQVTRHRLDVAAIAAKATEYRAKLLDLLADPAGKPDTWTMDHYGREAFRNVAVVDPEDPVLYQAIRTYAQAQTGEVVKRFASELGERTADVPFADRTITQSWKVLYHSSPISPLSAWFTAVISRDERCLELLRTASDRGPTPSRGWHQDFMQLTLALDKDEAAVRHALKVAGFSWPFDRTELATAEMMAPLAARDPVAFNAALARALRVHKTVYGTASRSRQSEGYVAVEPLALCCLAHDRGIPITVDSDYLLPYLVERRFQT
jgi:hypothetical protein